MKRRSKRAIFLICSFLASFLFLFLFFGTPSKLNEFQLDLESLVPHRTKHHEVSFASRPTKLTVIVVWTTRSATDPIYFPYFFNSVEANPQVDLLFVNVDKSGHGCRTFSDAPNVQVRLSR